MTYRKPEVADYGSITAHTFARSGDPCYGDSPTNKQGDLTVCEPDKYCEYSCSP